MKNRTIESSGSLTKGEMLKRGVLRFGIPTQFFWISIMYQDRYGFSWQSIFDFRLWMWVTVGIFCGIIFGLLYGRTMWYFFGSD